MDKLKIVKIIVGYGVRYCYLNIGKFELGGFQFELQLEVYVYVMSFDEKNLFFLNQ